MNVAQPKRQNSRSWRHHYVPQFYLQGFCCASGYLKVYDREAHPNAKHIPVDKFPKEVGFEEHLHSFPQSDGTVDDSLEDELKAVEDKAAPVFAKWNGLDHRVGYEEILIVSEYLAAQAGRTLRTAKGISDFEREAKRRKMLSLASDPQGWEAVFAGAEGELDAADVESARQQALAGELAFSPMHPKKAFLQGIISQAALIPQFAVMNWELLDAPEAARFVTNDAPVYVTGPDGSEPVPNSPYGFKRADAEVYFPVTQRLCLHLYNVIGQRTFSGRGTVSEVEVHAINEMTAALAERYVFCSFVSDRLKRWVREPKPTYRIRPAAVDRALADW